MSGSSWPARVSAPTAADSTVATVIPICTAERKRFGSRASLATREPRLPSSASLRTWLSRRETMAISAAAKNPPIRTKTRTRTMFAATLCTSIDVRSNKAHMMIWSAYRLRFISPSSSGA